MKQMFLLGLVVLPLASWASCPSDQAKDEAVLVQLEQTWAKALEQRDGAAIGCILAVEFEDADPNGALHSRAEALANIPHRRQGSNKLSDLHPHVYGDFGYVRGLNTVVDPIIYACCRTTGKPRSGKRERRRHRQNWPRASGSTGSRDDR